MLLQADNLNGLPLPVDIRNVTDPKPPISELGSGTPVQLTLQMEINTLSAQHTLRLIATLLLG